MDNVYFDYNIYTQLANGKMRMPEMYRDKARICISVAHAEEFFNARSNDSNGENKEQLDKIEAIFTRDLNSEGILKPTEKGEIVNRQESFLIR